MNDNNEGDKTTIRVQVSDAHQDIILDWSKDWYDIKRDTFRQLAEFTGIPLKNSYDISFSKLPVTNDVYPENPFVFRAGARAWFRVTNSYPRPEDIQLPRSLAPCKKQDFKDKFFRDGDCFALNTRLKMKFTLEELFVEYRLVHRDLIDETECSSSFCHHTSNKAFLDKQAKITNSDLESYLRAQPRPDPLILDRPYTIADELIDPVQIRKRKILADFNIGQYFNSYCKCLDSNLPFVRHRLRTYWPNRG
ncbi:uncharacterized protein LOC107368385 [Tetranychus urticae]|uniref:Uncharacterized protein n=1 Tax=Tetranychus urticae TaxID=32264 RepID=T1KXP2_TETUR|nr:uncharacterized protein LOC107368385 [Tetranychus urticae]